MENKKSGIFTLRNKEDGKRGDVLNGKIFYVKVESSDCIGSSLYFVDATSNNILWMTTRVEEKISLPDGVQLKTKNHLYDLVSLDSLIPSAGSVNNSSKTKSDEPTVAEQYVLDDLTIPAR